uniref:Retrotransposon protein n=1 Tax=Macrostomum lignano TaxID=282301 RepID=A0A1I8FKL7_9PLAT
MGNKLCGAGERDAAGLHQFHGGAARRWRRRQRRRGRRRTARLGEPGWHPKKDTHLLRLWAEVFRVRDNEFGWERVSDDVVPINITCLEDAAAGTPLYQANECFVHWKDLLHNCEWASTSPARSMLAWFSRLCLRPDELR